jgi:hypothetical protein
MQSSQTIPEARVVPALYLAIQHLFQNMPVTVLFALGAVTQERHGLRLREVLKQTERKLLAVVFDRAIARVDRAAFK